MHREPRRGLGVGRPDDRASHPPAGHTGWPTVWTVTAPALVVGSSSKFHSVGVFSGEILGQTSPPTPTIISGSSSDPVIPLVGVASGLAWAGSGTRMLARVSSSAANPAHTRRRLERKPASMVASLMLWAFCFLQVLPFVIELRPWRAEVCSSD